MSDKQIHVDTRRLERVGDKTEINAVYRAASKSRPGTWHYVIMYNDARGIKCDCEGFRFHGRCWHTSSVPMCLTLEQVTAGRYVAPRTCAFTKDHPGKHSFEYTKRREHNDV